VLLWIFLAVAAIFVLVLSAVLYRAGKNALFKGREASRTEKVFLFAMSILASCAAGVAIMIVFDIR
jgi:Na+/proline symporter